MGKSGKLLSSLVNGVKALRSPSTRENPAKEPPPTNKQRETLAIKQRCWSLGKSSSRNRGNAGAPASPGFDVAQVKQVQMHNTDLPDTSEPGISSLYYTSDFVERSPTRSLDDVVKLEPVPQSLCDVPQQEDWAAVLKLTDDSEPENHPSSNGLSNMTNGVEAELEEQAAILIQAAFRRHQAQRHSRALEAVVRLQALVRGRRVRKQVAMTRQCIHALVKFQACARGRRVRQSELGRLVQQHLQEAREERELEPSDGSRAQELGRRKEAASMLLASALNEQLHPTPLKKPSRPVDFEPDKDYWGWAWLDRWMGARPWENSGSPGIVREEAKQTAPAKNNEKNTASSEGSMDGTISRSSNLLNALVEHRITSPRPPPPPPLPSYAGGVHTSSPAVKLDTYIVEEMPSSTSLSEEVLSKGGIIQGMANSEVDAGATSGEEVTFSKPLLLTEINNPSPIRESTAQSDDLVCSAATSTSLEMTSSSMGEQAEHPQGDTMKSPDCDLEAKEQETTVISTSRPSSPQHPLLGEAESHSPVRPSTGKMREWQERITTLHIPDLENEGLEAESGQEIDMEDDTSHEDESPGMDEVNARPSNGGVSMAEEGQPDADIDHEMSVDHVLAEETSTGMSVDGNERSFEGPSGKEIDGDAVDSGKNVSNIPLQSETNAVAVPGSPKISRAPSKRMSSIAVKHEHNEGGSVPSYMATTKSAKAKARSHASPRPMPESPKQRLASPKQMAESSATKKTPGSEGKGTSPRPIVHVRAGSKGHLASISNTDSSSRALGGSKRHAK